VTEFWKGKHVVVTGARGFVGSFLVDAHYADPRQADVTCQGNCEAAFRDADAVFNLAAHVGGLYHNIAHQAEMHWGNVRCLAPPALAAAKASVPVYLQVSTVCVYADGLNNPAHEQWGHRREPEQGNAGYAWAKRMGERICHWAFENTDTRYSIVRPTNIYGPCFSGDTDVLTPEGLVNIKDIKVGDLVYTLNPSSHVVEIVPVARTQINTTDEFFNFRSRSVDFRVTSDHNIYYRTTTDFQKRPAEWFRARAGKDTSAQIFLATHTADFRDKGYPTRFSLDEYIDDRHIVGERTIRDYRHSHSSPMPRSFKIEDWVELLGWFITEGSVVEIPNNNGSSWQFRITQSQRHHPENCQRIESLLTRTGISFGYDGRSFYFTSRLLYNYVKAEVGIGAENKRIPRFVFDEQFEGRLRKLLFETMMLGDGTRNRPRYTTVSTGLKDDFIHLCFLIGLLTSARQHDGRTWKVSIYNKNRHPVVKYRNIEIEAVDNEPTYCFTAERNHLVFAGRNGKYNWIGQCDYFDDTAHVIPALIRKFTDGREVVKVFGGLQEREFIYVEDIARGMMAVAEKGKRGEAYNLGTAGATQISIAGLAEMIQRAVGFEGRVEWIEDVPTGDQRRSTNTDKAYALGWKHEDGEVVLEAGAYEGAWTKKVCQQRPGCQVFAFEPATRAYRVAVQRLKDYRGVTLQCVALGKQAGTATLCDRDRDGANTFAWNPEDEPSEIVPVVDVAGVVESLGEIALAHLNAEGGEVDILERLIETGLIERVRMVMVQFHLYDEEISERIIEVNRRLAETHCQESRYRAWNFWRRKDDDAQTDAL
jgi:FkbM family methyltransferase